MGTQRFKTHGKLGGDAIRAYKYYNPDARGKDIQEHFARKGIKVSAAYISQELNKFNKKNTSMVEVDTTPPQQSLELNDQPPAHSQATEDAIAAQFNYPAPKKTPMLPRKETPFIGITMPALSKKQEEELKKIPLEELEEMQDRAVVRAKTAIAVEVSNILNDPTADQAWRTERLNALAVLGRLME